MKWIIDRLKGLFWSTVISSIIFSFFAASFKNHWKTREIVRILMMPSPPSGVSVNSSTSLVKDIMSGKLSAPQPAPIEPMVAAVELTPQQVAQQGEDEAVRIDGRYYKRRADNRYLINGKIIFFQMNRRAPSEAESADEVTAVAASSSEEQSMIMTPAEMLKTMKESAEKIKEQRKQLDEL